MQTQLNTFLTNNNLLDPLQSGFKHGYSTETAVLSVSESLNLAKASAQSSDLILLDPSTAFDTVHHATLLSILTGIGLSGDAIHWFKSYLEGRSFSVSWQGQLSKPHKLSTGVPQGSVLGPLLFSIYTTSLPWLLLSLLRRRNSTLSVLFPRRPLNFGYDLCLPAEHLYLDERPPLAA